jgi:hypothetical protein
MCAMSTPVLAVPAVAGTWYLQAPDPVVVDKAPTGTYTLVPFDWSRVYIEGDLGKDANIHEARLKQLGPSLMGGLGIELAKMGVQHAESMEEASGLVITGELLLVDPGSMGLRMLTPGIVKAGRVHVIVLVRIVDASAPDKTLYSFLVEGEDRSGGDVYGVPGVIGAGPGGIPWSIAFVLKKPSRAKAKNPDAQARRDGFSNKLLAEARQKQVEAHGPAN